MKPRSPCWLFALVATMTTAALAEDTAVQLLVYVEPTGTAKGAYVSSGGNETPMVPKKDAEYSPIAFAPGLVDDLPISLTIEWDSQHSTSLPAFVFTPYSGKKIPVRVYRYNFKLEDTDRAEDLCWHTQPTDDKSAFRALFGCQEWVKLIESNNERWTNSHLWGLRGWFDGSYHLFTRVKYIDGLGLSPWGLQPELVRRLREVIVAIDGGQANQKSFEPFLRIADIRQALTEYDRWELRLYGLIPDMIKAGNLAGAKAINDRVKAAYERYAGPLATEAIDGVNRANLERSTLTIDQLLAPQ